MELNHEVHSVVPNLQFMPGLVEDYIFWNTIFYFDTKQTRIESTASGSREYLSRVCLRSSSNSLFGCKYSLYMGLHPMHNHLFHNYYTFPVLVYLISYTYPTYIIRSSPPHPCHSSPSPIPLHFPRQLHTAPPFNH